MKQIASFWKTSLAVCLMASLAPNALAVQLPDGVYHGAGAGHGGTTEVAVTISEEKISKIEVLSQQDTEAFFHNAEAVIDRVIEAQSTEVEAVSGATYSSHGILKAIRDALQETEGAEPTVFEVSSWKEFTNALAEAEDGDTIRLSDDIADAGNVDAISAPTATINKSVTIDGNQKKISAYPGQVTESTTDADGKTTTAEVDAIFHFNVTTAQDVLIQNLTIDGASFRQKLGGTMYVETGAGVTLDGVTIQNGRAGNSNAGNGGAALYVEPHRGESPVLVAKNCTFSGNVVNDGTTGRGGAVYAYNANVTLENCTFLGNQAGYGGAVAAAGSASLTVSNCTFAENDGAVGGENIYLFDGYTPYKKGMVVDSAVQYSISDNQEQDDGSTYADYNVVLGRVLGTEGETTYVGSGETGFLPGHEMTFPIETEAGKARTEKAE